jgi:hypothetical protein
MATTIRKEINAKRLTAARQVSSWTMLRVLGERYNTEVAWFLVCVLVALDIYWRMGR